jgi:hypothetical protein
MTPKQRADTIARKTFDHVWRSPGGRSVDGLLELSEGYRISYLHKFKMPDGLTPDDFAEMIAKAFQVIVNEVYGREALRVHVSIKYTESFDAGPYFGLLPSSAMTSWYVTKNQA